MPRPKSSPAPQRLGPPNFLEFEVSECPSHRPLPFRPTRKIDAPIRTFGCDVLFVKHTSKKIMRYRITSQRDTSARSAISGPRAITEGRLTWQKFMAKRTTYRKRPGAKLPIRRKGLFSPHQY